MKHLEAFSLIRDSQHSFKRGRSCVINLQYLYEEIHDKIYNRKPVDMIWMPPSLSELTPIVFDMVKLTY